jgi:hypothetical protein
MEKFLRQFETLETLVAAKNAAYGGSWRLMRPSTIRDLISCKVARIEQLEHGAPDNGEGIRDSLQDIAAYALWELVRLHEDEEDRTGHIKN